MKKHLLLVTLSLFMLSAMIAQTSLTGTVTDSDGAPIMGAAVLLQGTTTGAYTDKDGNYTLSAPSDATTLVFTYVGKRTVEELISGRSTIDVAMEASALELEEVVVTGLGIKKEKKALGYGVSTISNDAIQGRQEQDIARILRGKATGVNIVQTSGLSGSGTNVIIRGYSSITGDNQPLFIVDGIPINTSTNSTGFNQGGATASSRFLDLDPNNIEEVSILKGLSATVLYGEAGRNGVILITTKNGSGGANANKKLEITVNQQVSRTEIANLPDYQDTYGNGFNAGFGWFFSNWGAAFNDLNPSSYGGDYQGERNGQVLITHPYDQAQYNDDLPQFIGAEYPYQPYPGVEDFFSDPGLTSNTSVSIQSKLGNNSSISATYSYLNDEGFTPDLDESKGGGPSNFIEKHNFGLGAQTKLANGLKIKGSFNYVDSDRKAPLTAPAFGGDGNGLFAALLFTPRSMDLMGLPYDSPIDGSNVYYRRGAPIQNPRWTLNNAGETENISRFISTMELSYELTPWLTALYRLGVDRYTQTNVNFINRNGAQVPDGQMQTRVFKENVTDQLLNFLYNFQLSEDFTLDGILGANLRRQEGVFNGLFSSNQFVFGIINHQNFIDDQSGSGFQEENTLGVYATTTLGFKNFLYLSGQARNDWTSTLESNNNSIFYPSASLSFIPTEAIPGLQNNSIVNYLKLRVGFGTSAGYPDPYQTRNILATGVNQFVTQGGAVVNTNEVSDQLGNPDLQRELHREYEGGIEARFFNSRVGLDISVYDRNSSDLIINQQLDPATGFTNTTVNAAEVENRGIEASLDLTPVSTGDFQWNITLNYTRNISEVIKIADGVDQIQIAGFTTLGNYAFEGEPYGVMFGETFLKDEESGRYIVDGAGNYQSSGNFGIIGDPNPDFQANWINNISWKGLSFGFQWQYISGGDVSSSTIQALMARGNTVDTDVDRNLPLVLPGLKQLPDGTLVENDIQTYIGDSFFRAYFFADEGGVFDGTVIRLREISLSYILPQALIDNTPFGRVGITFSGENLWYNAPNFPEGINFDPEVLSLGVGNGRGFDFRTAPTAKRYGVALNLTF
ncbi:MAG: SusC/RagA family TonB-linked outer membrane protein [Bacteroidota bacterium]